ncbi:MAG: hypothetical protein ACYC6Y_26820 [Thermoguttaceae bacterium]
MPETISVILSEPRHGDARQQQVVDLLSGALSGRPSVDLTIVPHLYDLEPSGPTMEYLREIRGPMILISWLYPRAAFWTLRTGGVEGALAGPDEAPSGDRPVWCLAMHPHVDPRGVLDDVDRIVAGAHVEATGPVTPKGVPRRWSEEPRQRWYPVIDGDRCSGCLECLNFCLFGVYGTDLADSILIEQPDACRTGCPACSRICPEGAIMFPQHADPAIAGDAEASLSGLKLDLSQLFSGAEPTDLALAERDRALSQMESPVKRADKLDDLVDELDGMEI